MHPRIDLLKHPQISHKSRIFAPAQVDRVRFRQPRMARTLRVPLSSAADRMLRSFTFAPRTSCPKDLERSVPVHRVRARLWVEAILGALCLFLAALTLITREWIEELFGVDPDGGNGSLEWLIVAGLGIAAFVAGAMARSEWRRSSSAG